MIKITSVLFFMISFIFASNIQISAKSFQYDKANNISYFRNDVNVTKEKDNILSTYLTVYFNKNKHIDKMIAEKNVRFIIHDKNSTYKGRSNSITFIVPKDLFIFTGNVQITKLEDNQKLFGDRVIINKKTGDSRVFGKKDQPVKFIFKVKN
jgi:lipopolysaccharide export system protein LptA